MVVFARGSGQNSDSIFQAADGSYGDDTNTINSLYKDAGVNSAESQTATFIANFHNRIPNGVKYVSLHNETSSTGQKYNQYGYIATSAFDAISGPFNTFSKPPLHRKDVPNRYYESVKDGAEELAWYLEDQMTSCPLQQVVLGGYSQGAEVVADGINIMQPDFRARIADVALYGDPKFNPREDGSYVKGPWVRGDAAFPNFTGGILSPRKQYVPDDIPSLGSWCASGDKICDAGIRDSRALLNSLKDAGNVTNPAENKVHSNAYQDTWIPKSMNDIVELVRDRLPNIDMNTSVYINKNDKLWDLDLAIVLDTTSSMSDDLKIIKGNANGLSGELLNSYWNSRVGIVTYGGLPLDYNDPSYQYSSVITPFTNNEDLVRQGFQSIAAQEPYYGLMPDGTTPYPLTEQSAQLDGIMTAINGLQWEHGAQKKIIVITNNKARDPDPSPNHWTSSQVKQAAFDLDPAGLNLANVSCGVDGQTERWGCDNSIDEQFQSLANGGGQIADVDISYGTLDELNGLLETFNTQPVASISGDHDGYVGSPVQLNAGDSYDPNGAVSFYSWDCDSDGTNDVFSGPNASCTYDSSGDYLVTLNIGSSDGQNTQATWQVHISAGSPPITPAAPESPDATLTYADSSLNLSWNNAYSSDVYLRVSDENDNLIGYAPADAKSVLLAGIGSEVPALHVSACTDAGGCSDPTIVALDHDKLDAMVVAEDTDTFVVPQAPSEPDDYNTTPLVDTVPGSQSQQSKNDTDQPATPATDIEPAVFTDSWIHATDSVLGDTATNNVAEQFSKHGIAAASTVRTHDKTISRNWRLITGITAIALGLFFLMRYALIRGNNR